MGAGGSTNRIDEGAGAIAKFINEQKDFATHRCELAYLGALAYLLECRRDEQHYEHPITISKCFVTCAATFEAP